MGDLLFLINTNDPPEMLSNKCILQADYSKIVGFVDLHESFQSDIFVWHLGNK